MSILGNIYSLMYMLINRGGRPGKTQNLPRETIQSVPGGRVDLESFSTQHQAIDQAMQSVVDVP